MDHGPPHRVRLSLAAKYLADPNATTLTILGCGLQGRSHLEVIKSMLPKLSKVKAFDIRRDVADVRPRAFGAPRRRDYRRR